MREFFHCWHPKPAIACDGRDMCCWCGAERWEVTELVPSCHGPHSPPFVRKTHRYPEGQHSHSHCQAREEAEDREREDWRLRQSRALAEELARLEEARLTEDG